MIYFFLFRFDDKVVILIEFGIRIYGIEYDWLKNMVSFGFFMKVIGIFGFFLYKIWMKSFLRCIYIYM